MAVSPFPVLMLRGLASSLGRNATAPELRLASGFPCGRSLWGRLCGGGSMGALM